MPKGQPETNAELDDALREAMKRAEDKQGIVVDNITTFLDELETK